MKSKVEGKGEEGGRGGDLEVMGGVAGCCKYHMSVLCDPEKGG